MGTLTQLATSLEYVWQEVGATLISGVTVNPTGDAVFMAFVPQPASGPPPNPTSGQYNTAIWQTGPGPAYWAGCLVGPGGTIQLAAGSYVIGVKVTDNPEVPVKWGWTLIIVLPPVRMFVLGCGRCGYTRRSMPDLIGAGRHVRCYLQGRRLRRSGIRQVSPIVPDVLLALVAQRRSDDREESPATARDDSRGTLLASRQQERSRP